MSPKLQERLELALFVIVSFALAFMALSFGAALAEWIFDR